MLANIFFYNLVSALWWTHYVMATQLLNIFGIFVVFCSFRFFELDKINTDIILICFFKWLQHSYSPPRPLCLRCWSGTAWHSLCPALPWQRTWLRPWRRRSWRHHQSGTGHGRSGQTPQRASSPRSCTPAPGGTRRQGVRNSMHDNTLDPKGKNRPQITYWNTQLLHIQVHQFHLVIRHLLLVCKKKRGK